MTSNLHPTFAGILAPYAPRKRLGRRASIEAHDRLMDEMRERNVVRPPIWECLPAHGLSGLHGKVLRRWAESVCKAECNYARDRFARRNPMWDRYADPDLSVLYRLNHEVAAGTVLRWLAELDSHEYEMRKTAAQTRQPPSAEYLRRKRVRWVYLARGFLRAVSAYRAARAAVEMRSAA